MSKYLSLVAVLAFSLTARVAAAQQCGSQGDIACLGTCPTGNVCGVSTSGTACECAAAGVLTVGKMQVKLN